MKEIIEKLVLESKEKNSIFFRYEFCPNTFGFDSIYSFFPIEPDKIKIIVLTISKRFLNGKLTTSYSLIANNDYEIRFKDSNTEEEYPDEFTYLPISELENLLLYYK